MNRILFSTAMLALLLCLRTSPAPALEVGATAPELELKDTDGNTVRLAELRDRQEGEEKKGGQVTLITFWSFKCPTGKQYLSKMSALSAWCKENGVVFVAVDSYGETADQVKAYRQENAIPHPVFMDENQEVATALGAQRVTHTIVLDRQGRVAYQGGFDNGAAADAGDLEPHARTAAKQVVDGQPVTTPETKAKG